MLRSTSKTFLACLVVAVLAMPGCSGCSWNWFWRTTTPETKKEGEAEKPKEKPKPDFEQPRLVLQPSDPAVVQQIAKPGHWASATLEMQPNNYDFTGELDSEVVNPNGQPVELPRTPFRSGASRPVALTKGQKKFLEMTLFMPPDEQRPQLAVRLRGRAGGDVIGMLPEPMGPMPSHQYFFYIAARNPERYSFFKVLDAIRPPGDDTVILYRVLAPPIDKQVPLPTNPLTWTSIAFVLWDDVPPAAFDPGQQQALVDWLHWGGQLIISGPDTLEALKGSFIEPYLPAKSAGATQITDAELVPLNARWTLDNVIHGRREPGTPLVARKPWVGVKLALAEGGEAVPDTGGLLVERRVGRGRVVVSAFRLNERDLLAWPGFDGFINACILRHPPRRFREGNLADVAVNWSGDNATRQRDPTLLTDLRYLGRDAGFKFSPMVIDPQRQPYDLSGSDQDSQPSLGMWSDFNPISNAARTSLREAAGIEIPRPQFVLWAVAIYLAVLVPLNWLVFKLLGRVEWAWFAAPVIALAGTAAVTKSAHLDIGFTRSQREVALVELQAGYPRAHASRYTSLYTSLSTTYDLHFDDASALAQPFSADVDRVLGQGTTKVDYRRDDHVRLSGFPVSSNATGMVHSEHMVDLGGGLSIAGGADQQRIVNRTRLNLLDAAVMRRLENGTFELAPVGALDAGASQPLVFSAIDPSEANKDWQKSLTGASAQHPEAASLRHVVTLLANAQDLEPGDSRLVAWTLDEIAGLRVDPPSPQVQHATIVVANLAYAAPPRPERDENTRASISGDTRPRFQTYELPDDEPTPPALPPEPAP